MIPVTDAAQSAPALCVSSHFNGQFLVSSMARSNLDANGKPKPATPEMIEKIDGIASHVGWAILHPSLEHEFSRRLRQFEDKTRSGVWNAEGAIFGAHVLSLCAEMGMRTYIMQLHRDGKAHAARIFEYFMGPDPNSPVFGDYFDLARIDLMSFMYKYKRPVEIPAELICAVGQNGDPTAMPPFADAAAPTV